MSKLEQMQERARDLVIKIASRELYDADADHTNIAYYEEQVCNGLDQLITEVWNEAIKECEWCVPEEVPSMPLLHLDSKEGYKLCREQTLQAIRQLAYKGISSM